MVKVRIKINEPSLLDKAIAKMSKFLKHSMERRAEKLKLEAESLRKAIDNLG